MPLAVMLGEVAGTLDMMPGVFASLCEGVRRHAPFAAAGADAAVDVQVLHGEDALAAAAPAWREIEAAGGLANPFQSLALAEAAARAHRAVGETPVMAIVRDGRRPVALLALVRSRTGGLATLRFLGDPLIQYGDVLARPDAPPAAIAAALDALARSQHGALLDLRKVRADARIAPLLAERATVVAHDEAPFVEVADAESGGRKRRDERELRRFRRRLAERGTLAFSVTEGAAARPLLRQAFNLKRQWLAERDLASQVVGDLRWEEALSEATTAAGPARIVVACLAVDGRSAAIEVGLVQGRGWFAFLGATDPDFAKAGPGQVLMADTIAYCRQAGLTVYDLLPPGQAYKQAIATGSVAVTDYAVPVGLGGRLALIGLRLRPAAKRALAAMPPALRRLVARTVLDTRKN